VPDVTRACLAALGTQLLSLKQQILEFDRLIMAWHRSNQTSKRLHYIPGVGPMLATALVASVADPRTFRSGRNFSAWIARPRSPPSRLPTRLRVCALHKNHIRRQILFGHGLVILKHRFCASNASNKYLQGKPANNTGESI
jgi:transposase